MDPKGKNPAMTEIIDGSKYHFLSGIGLNSTNLSYFLQKLPWDNIDSAWNVCLTLQIAAQQCSDKVQWQNDKCANQSD